MENLKVEKKYKQPKIKKEEVKKVGVLAKPQQEIDTIELRYNKALEEIKELKNKLKNCKCEPKPKKELTEEQKKERKKKQEQKKKEEEDKKNIVDELKAKIVKLEKMLESKLLTIQFD